MSDGQFKPGTVVRYRSDGARFLRSQFGDWYPDNPHDAILYDENIEADIRTGDAEIARDE